MSYKILVVAVLAVAVLADIVPDTYKPPHPHPHHHPHPHPHPNPHPHPHPYPHVPPKYDFHYTVKDKYNDFGHWESRDGDNTSGKYITVLPDGRTQIVTYTVSGKTGYVANVVYEGEAVHPKQTVYKPEY
ncbi:cuticle protein 8-like [Portunus trituberculatus]|uniref:cuticle protein 8-like n=1 Tax=Portunus trituberculatus TaxID=210409 RepID=UPI001E1CD5C9|nr:cuticle protein 8-like [Portunus trituberculatus]